MSEKIAAVVIALIGAIRDEVGATSTPDLDPLVTAADMGMPPKIWGRAAKTGELHAARIGGTWRARKSDADKWIASLLEAQKTATTKVEHTEDNALDRAMAKRRLRVVKDGSR